MDQLRAFVPLAGDYARSRNDVNPPRGGVSRLSPYLRIRLLLEEEVVREVLAVYPERTVSKFIDEVLWRTYWKGWLELRPQIWMEYRRRVGILLDRLDNGARERYNQAVSGATPFDCMNSWTHELIDTGWLHNHVRMWFASIWTMSLRLPWELGADFFMRHLLDGDPASNTLSWRWVAGLHTPGKAYVARAANIREHTGARFDPRGLNENPPMPVPPRFPDPVPLGPLATFRDATLPSLSASPCGLLVTEEDLAPEIRSFADCPFSSIAVFSAPETHAELRLDDKVFRFRSQAVEDCAKRLAIHWDGELVRVDHDDELAFRAEAEQSSYVSRPTRMRVYSGSVDCWIRAVRRWAVREHLNAVRVLQPPVGPLRERIPRLRAELRRVGVKLIEHRREWDEVHWPQCGRGYFAFRKDSRERLAELGVFPQ